MVAPGSRLGPYEVVALVGEGGMGQVFKARDTRLDRTVAIKVLPASLAADASRRERFEREARNVSRLEHPNICQLYDVGEHDGQLYLVMQFLEGETLAERLQAGPLSIKQTLDCGLQIAEALGAAHRADIVHRDLKPGNVMLTRNGVRLLDFGLARSVPARTSGDTTMVGRTAISSLTVEGTILGTLSYMAPEQIEGRDVDTRADVFAFGAVLFEMVTGLKAFEADSPAGVMSAILRDEPARVASIVPVAPAALDALIHECLAKDANERWQNTGDVARQLRHMRDMMSGAKSGSLPASAVLMRPTGPSATVARVAWAAAAVLALATALLLFDRVRTKADPAPGLQLHALLLAPPGMYLTDTLSLSPDGQQLAFVAADAACRRRLWVRPLASNAAEPLAGTEDASDPFWSPDGQQLAFFAGGRLKRIGATGGTVATVTDVTTGAGGAWNRDNVILFAQLDGPLMQVPSAGGRAEPVTTFDRALEETHHLYPTFLPDGRRFIYYVNSRERGLYAGELGTSRKTRLFDPDPALPAGAAATPGVYSTSGHLLLRPRSRPDGASVRPRVAGEHRRAGHRRADRRLRSSRPGGFHHRQRHSRLPRQAASPGRRTGLARSYGRDLGTIAAAPGTFRTVALSPDGRTLAVDRLDPQGLPAVWLVDTASGAGTRLTAAYWAGDPLWSPDGQSLAYSIAVDSPPNLVLRRRGNDAPEQRLTTHASEQHYATSFTPDGRQLVYQSLSPATGLDLYLVAAGQKKAAPQRLLQTRANESLARVAPDGRWVAFVSDETGQPEVYVSRFPEMQGKVALSSGGATQPFWRRDGRELFFLAADGRVMAVTLSPSEREPQSSRPTELFRATLYGNVFVPAADGQRFLVARPVASGEIVPLEIVVNPLR